MPKFRVQLSRLSRETKIVTIEAENKEAIDLEDVYWKYGCNEDDWEPDVDWGTKAGTLSVLEEEV